ncbi:hypothetical protein V6N13_113796 [Hibiscus sabdariffa]|uniref:Uncharacterized protein n=2 Tax=Hibiscus sabdariffa TaxID=183260 RepID=A0ABR1ZML8_9ROSI
MSKYEGQAENHLALWEDIELRGFLPLAPAHTILDFSKKHSFISNNDKEKKARVKRIFLAGKALTNAIRVDQKTVYFDSKEVFFIGVEPFKDVTFSYSAPPAMNNVGHETPSEKTINVANV